MYVFPTCIRIDQGNLCHNQYLSLLKLVPRSLDCPLGPLTVLLLLVLRISNLVQNREVRGLGPVGFMVKVGPMYSYPSHVHVQRTSIFVLYTKGKPFAKLIAPGRYAKAVLCRIECGICGNPNFKYLESEIGISVTTCHMGGKIIICSI